MAKANKSLLQMDKQTLDHVIRLTNAKKILDDKKYIETIPIAQPKGLCLRVAEYNRNLSN